MLTHLHTLQAHNGSFPSMVSGRQRLLLDRNGFTTALVLRALRHNLPYPSLRQLRTDALRYLWRCQSSERPGAFEFWPPKTRPNWAADFPADLDDTATMLGELLRHGCVLPQEVRKQVCEVFTENRVRLKVDFTRPHWIKNGAFHTWIVNDRRQPNVVDCTVNANVVSLLSALDLKDLPGYQSGVDTIISGCHWAGKDPDRLHSLSPFYPDPVELYYAVMHAVESGVEQLRLVKDKLFVAVKADLGISAGAHCRNAYGDVVWKSPALVLARRIARNPKYLTPRVRDDIRTQDA